MPGKKSDPGLTSGGPDLTHFVHDRMGNVIADSDGSGPAGTVREYIWLPETRIGPAMGSRAQVDRPIQSEAKNGP